MALRAMYKGFKKVLAPLIIKRPGELAIDQDALNAELNTVFFPRSEQAVLGAKNWFNIDAPNTVHNATLTKTATSLRVQGTAKTYSNVNYVFRNLPLNTAFKLQMSVDYTSGLGKISVEGSTDGSTYTAIASKTNITSDQDVSFSFNTGNYTYIRVIFFCSDSAAIDGDITYSYIMIYLATDTDSTYAPYAMTNKELTDAVATLNGSASDQKTAINAIITAATGAADFAAFKTAMGAITPVTRSIQVTLETREEIIEPVEEVKKTTTRKKSTAKAETEKEGE